MRLFMMINIIIVFGYYVDARKLSKKCLFNESNETSTAFNSGNDYHPFVSYKGFQLMRVTLINDTQATLLDNFVGENNIHGPQIDVWSDVYTSTKSVDLLVSPNKILQLRSFAAHEGLSLETLIQDIESDINDTYRDSQSTFQRSHQPTQNTQDNLASSLKNIQLPHFFNKFRPYSEIQVFLHFLQVLFPTLVSVESIGKSFEKRNMKVIRITSSVNMNHGTAKPIFLMDGGIHAREWISSSTVLATAYILASQYEKNKHVKNILDSWEFRILPVANPDGYEHTHKVDRLWRKTRSINKNSKCFGADPNRNFDIGWENPGSSFNPCSELFRGSKPFSEIETRNMANYMKKHKNDTKIYIAVHSFSQAWYSPWAYTSEPPSDSQILVSKAKAAATMLAQVHGTKYKVGRTTALRPPATGIAMDYAKGVLGIPFVYSIELPPSPSKAHDAKGFLPPPEKIRPTGIETTVGFIALAQAIEGNKMLN